MAILRQEWEISRIRDSQRTNDLKRLSLHRAGVPEMRLRPRILIKPRFSRGPRNRLRREIIEEYNFFFIKKRAVYERFFFFFCAVQ